MADLADVTSYFANTAAAAIYPNGTSQASVAAMDVRIYEGWPLPDKLDKDVQGLTDAGTPRTNGPAAHVSIYPMAGTGSEIFQVQDNTYTITPPVVNLGVSTVGTLITVTGQPAVGEFLTLVVDDKVVLSQTGANTAALLAALAAQGVSAGYAASSTATTLTIPFGHSLVVRQGGQALMGKVTHRQRHLIMVTAWAPNRVARNKLCAAVDVLLKESIRVTLPDTSQMIVCYNRTNVSDDQQETGIYRRDLIYQVDYATLQTFPGFTITSVNTTIASAAGNAQATALT